METNSEEKKLQENNGASTFSIDCPIQMPPPPLIASETRLCGGSALITKSPYGKIVIDRSDIPLLQAEIEIQNAFTKAISWNLLSAKSPTLAIYTQVPPIIQRGPQCGLIALSMATYAFPPFMSAQSLLEKSRAKGISNHGEMFSSVDFADLANNTLQLTAVVRKDILGSPRALVKTLLERSLLLVPYDSERNHTPGQSIGHKAHWGLLCGCILQLNSFSLVPPLAKQDEEIANLFHYDPFSENNENISPSHTNCSSSKGNRDTKCRLGNIPPASDNRLIVLWRQGKSRNLIMSRLSALKDSNEQLEEYPDSSEYVIKSVKDGLAGQTVVLT